MNAPAATAVAGLDLAAVRQRYPERQASIDGHLWRWRESGRSGPCIVLLPGAQGTAEVFGHQLDGLGADCRVLAVWYPAIAAAPALADGLLGLLDHLGIERIHLVGGSFGGHWAQVFAARHPERVATLFVVTSFVDPTPMQRKGKPPAEIEATDAELIRQQRTAMVQNMAEPLRSALLDMGERQEAENLKARVLGIAIALPAPALTLPAQRIVVIDCEDDPVIAPPMRIAVRERYAASPQYTLATGGHFPALLNPIAFNDIIARHVHAGGAT